MEKFQLTVRDIFVYKQKSERVSVSPRTYSALSFKARTSGRYVAEGVLSEHAPGALCLVPADVAYRRESEAEDIYVFHFDATPLLPREIRVLQVKDTAACRARFEEALRLWQRQEAGDHYRVSAILYELFAEIAASMVQAEPKADYLSQTKRYMEEHFSIFTLSIEDLARRAHVSTACLRRRFAERYGCAPKQYLDHLRMGHAQKLLQTGYYDTREIAQRCGYGDVGYFCTAFRRHTGVTVSDYRRSVI